MSSQGLSSNHKKLSQCTFVKTQKQPSILIRHVHCGILDMKKREDLILVLSHSCMQLWPRDGINPIFLPFPARLGDPPGISPLSSSLSPRTVGEKARRRRRRGEEGKENSSWNTWKEVQGTEGWWWWHKTLDVIQLIFLPLQQQIEFEKDDNFSVFFPSLFVFIVCRNCDPLPKKVCICSNYKFRETASFTSWFFFSSSAPSFCEMEGSGSLPAWISLLPQSSSLLLFLPLSVVSVSLYAQ